MNLLAVFDNVGGLVTGTIIPFLFVLTIVVFFHELGHFLIARWAGVAVKVFSVGFGPELIGFTDRRGTRWRVSLIPLGGYVRFLGDETAAGGTDHAALQQMTPTERSNAFPSKSVGRRAAIVAAGPIANFILAIVIFTGMFAIVGERVMSARVDGIVAGSAAERAGFQAGDVVVSIDGQTIGNFSELQRIVSVSAGDELSVVVKRGDDEVTLAATPELKEIKDQFGNASRVGILGINRSPTADQVVTERYSVPAAAWRAVQETAFVVDRTFSYLYGVIVGREFGQPARRTPAGRRNIRPGRIDRLSAAHQSGGDLVDKHRAHKPFPDSAPRWRALAVLPRRGHPRPSAQRKGPGHRLSHRLCRHGRADGFRNLE